MDNSSVFLTYTQYFLDMVGVIWYNAIIEIGGRRMKYTGRLIQFFTFVEQGRGPPRGKPEKFFFSKPANYNGLIQFGQVDISEPFLPATGNLGL